VVLVAQSVLALETRPTCRGKNFIRFASFDLDNNGEIFTEGESKLKRVEVPSLEVGTY